jgi:hypothetical protein
MAKVEKEITQLHESVFDNSQLIGQFVVSAGRSQSPRGWISDQIDGWFLGRHPRLPAIRLIAEEHGSVGWILGYPISDEGVLLAEGQDVRVPARAMATAEGLETFVYSFGGRFAVVVLDARFPRFYLDPCGSLSAVYCARQRLVASTPNLIPRDDFTQDRVELARAIGIPHSDGMFPFTMTPRFGIERILPNHYLDLGEWRTIRHWPAEPLAETPDVAEAVAEIATIVKRQIAAVVATTPAYLPLTAGLDSRMLLACARGLAERLELFTRDIRDTNSTIDCDTAQRIAKQFGLKHRVLPMVRATEADLDEWMFRISYSSSELRGWQCATMYKQLPGGHAVLGGQAGEVARGYYWRESDTQTTEILPERLIEICECPLEEEPLEKARAWLDTVPAVNALQILDLFFVEQDMGGWAGIVPYAECDPGFVIFPLCHRTVVQRMLTLPASYRRSGQMPRDIIAREWPELLRWPVNEPIGFTRLLLRARKAVQKGRIALRHPDLALAWLRRVTLGSSS